MTDGKFPHYTWEGWLRMAIAILSAILGAAGAKAAENLVSWPM